MRSLQQIDDDIKKLQEERKVAVDAASPLKQRVQRRYVMIHELLDQLNQLGENVGDINGYALYIKGKTFEIGPTEGVLEVE